MAYRDDFVHAYFIQEGGSQDRQRIDVHFNPSSLQHVLSNTSREGGRGNERQQYVTGSTAKLSMELVFDTTPKGADVRLATIQIARMLEPFALQGAASSQQRNRGRGQPRQVPPSVTFYWGTFQFRGLVDSFEETLDYFSSSGVPLRATVRIGMTRHDKVFDLSTEEQQHTDSILQLSQVEQPPGSSATDAATRAGDPNGGRRLAAANGEENMRHTTGRPLNLNPSSPWRPPPGFSPGISPGGPSSVGSSFSASLGGGSSFNAGASSMFGTQGGNSAPSGLRSDGQGITPAESGRASAGVPATAGAFRGLRSPDARPSSSVAMDPSRLWPTGEDGQRVTEEGAAFRIGGQAVLQGAGEPRADVGLNATLRGRLRFEGD